MDKSQILTSIVVALLVIGIAVYRLLWVGSSSAAAIGLRRFPKTPSELRRWFFKEHDSSPAGSTAAPNTDSRENP